MTTQTLETQALTANGTTVSYLDSADSRGTTRVFVLVHGTGGSAERHFGFLHPILANKQRVVSINLADPGTESLSVDQLADQVAAVLAGLPAEAEVTLLGYSLGAAVAAQVAAIHSERVANLVLVCGWAKSDAQQTLRNGIWRTLRAENSDALARYWAFTSFGGPFIAARAPQDFQPFIDGIRFSPFVDKQMELNAALDITASVESIECPTLVVGCTHDQTVPIRHSKWLWAAIPDARFAEIDAGHAVVFERPAQLCALVQEFVEEPNKFSAGSIVDQRRP